MPTYLQFAPRAFINAFWKNKMAERQVGNEREKKETRKGKPKWEERIDNLKSEARRATRKTKGSLRCLWRRAHKQTLYIHLQRVTSSFINSSFFLIIQQVKLVDISSFPGSHCVQALQATRETVEDSRQSERMLFPPSSDNGKGKERENKSKPASKGGRHHKVVSTIS